MPIIGTDKQIDSRIQLFLEPYKFVQLDSPQEFAAGETEYELTAFPRARLRKVYMFSAGAWQEVTNFVLRRNVLVFDAVTTGKILCLSRRHLQLMYILESTPEIIPVYPAGNIRMQYADFTISSKKLNDLSTGNLLFAEAKTGPWQASLTLNEIPTIVWVKGAADNLGVDVAINLDATVFLRGSDYANM